MSKRKPYQFSKPSVMEQKGKVFWTSLEAKADPEGFQKRATAEFPDGVVPGSSEDQTLTLGRRSFMGIAGAAGALLGLEGCVRRPEEKILPFTRQPEYVVPGVSLHYATATRSAGDVIGLLVETTEGRPIKVDGNPNHPGSLGGTDGYAQASILDLYDPDRSRGPAQREGEGFAERSFADLDKAIGALTQKAQAGRGKGLAILATPTASPTFVRVRDELRQKLPEARLYAYEPVSSAERKAGVKLAFGQTADVAFSYRRAKVIVALDADFLGTEPGSVRATREWADGRRLTSPRDTMNRLYVAEPGFSLTGANADHRLRLPARDVGPYLKALAAELATIGVTVTASLGQAKAPEGVPEKWVKTVAKELADSKGQSVVVVGTRQPAAVHALAFALNHALGNLGRTVQLIPALDDTVQGALDGIVALAKDLSAGSVETLLVLGGNPVFDAPADLKLGDLIAKVPTSIHLGEFRDETSARTTWHVPRAHSYESWGDLRGTEGVTAIQQPLIAPLHGGRSDIELLALFAGIPNWRGHALVRATARKALPAQNFEQLWKNALHVGVARELTAQPLASAGLDADGVAKAARAISEPASKLGPQNLEVHFAPDPALYDGRHGNNQWMLELPDPISCVSWDNCAYVSPATAKALNIANYDLVNIKDASGNALEIVTWVVPGITDHTISVHLGWGREVVGRYGKGAGFNAYKIRTQKAFGFGDGFTVEPTGRRYDVSLTQETHSMEGRPIAIDATLEEYRKQPEFADFKSPTLSTLPLWKEVRYEGHRWSIAIDLNSCTGCNACLIACHAENNVASVGKEQIARGRDMFWQRMDRYFVGDDVDNPQVAFQPVSCQHCEEAPCENVCPVNATAHSPEGLNDMAYNRCIGTRYCMNNCPYKVRRFNFLDYTGQVPETRRMAYNPNVSVRMRGVMEKCTYCVQRIQEAKINARRENRPLRDGDVNTACQQACAAGGVAFGDLNDKNSRVSKLTRLDRQYKLIPEVGTQPRTSYLAKIRNPNPEMQG